MPLNLIGFNDNDTIIEFMRFKITFSMLTEAMSGSKEDVELAQLNQSTSFSKVITFIEAVLTNSMVITQEMSEEVRQSLLISYDNNVIVLPQCAEVYLIASIHKKLNSIVSEGTIVESVSLEDLENNLTYHYTLVDDEYTELPDTQEWLGDYSVWDQPWWDRCDIC